MSRGDMRLSCALCGHPIELTDHEFGGPVTQTHELYGQTCVDAALASPLGRKITAELNKVTALEEMERDGRN